MHCMGDIKQVVGIIAISLLLTVGLAYFAGQRNSAPELNLINDTEAVNVGETDSALPAPLSPDELAVTNPENINTMNPIAVLNTNKGTIEVELFADVMPTTAGNFEKLVNEGFYNGIKFHRVIDGFMIQGGDPLTKDDSKQAMWGTGGPGYAIADEFKTDPRITNVRGTLSMANSGPNTGGSQFFLNTNDNTYLDTKHPVFGRVISGMDVVDAISKTATDANDRPLEPIIIESATIKPGA